MWTLLKYLGGYPLPFSISSLVSVVVIHGYLIQTNLVSMYWKRGLSEICADDYGNGQIRTKSFS